MNKFFLLFLDQFLMNLNLFTFEISSILNQNSLGKSFDQETNGLIFILERLQVVSIIEHLTLKLHGFVVNCLVDDMQLWQVVQTQLKRQQLEFEFNEIERHYLKASPDIATGIEVLALDVQECHALENMDVAQVANSVNHFDGLLQFERRHWNAHS